MILRSRRYLPHLEFPNSSYFITFRLNGSVPTHVLEKWKDERNEILQRAAQQKRRLSEYERQRLHYLFSKKVEEYLDQTYGDCWLKEPRIAGLVADALKYFNRQKYNLHAWCVMPNHVHVVLTVISKAQEPGSDLIPILHSWKSYTGHRANQMLQRKRILLAAGVL